MARIASAGLSAVALLATIAGSHAALATKNYYGTFIKHPTMPTEWVRSLVTVPTPTDANSVPTSVGIQFTTGFIQDALAIPNDPQLTYTEDGATYNERQWYLQIPQEGTNPFHFIHVVWNPQGHPPAPVYTTPHFDLHFYFDTFAAYNAFWNPATAFGQCYGTSPSTFAAIEKPIGTDCFPPNHANVGNVVPLHGDHLAWLLDPNFAPPQSNFPFNKTVIYGANNGEIKFIEPMVSRNYLLSKTNWNLCWDLQDAPKAYPSARYVPTTACIRSAKSGTQDTIVIDLRNFVPAVVGCGSTNAPLSYWPTGGNPPPPPLPAGCVPPKA